MPNVVIKKTTGPGPGKACGGGIGIVDPPGTMEKFAPGDTRILTSME